jgi:O-6-methylguanine DNA methyltransferase
VTNGRYLRTVKTDSCRGIIEVRDADGFVELTVHGIGTDALFAAVQKTRGLFDLDAPIDDIASVLKRDSTLRDLLKRSPGVRVPGAWDGFELTIRAVLGQQVSVKAATTFAGRVAERYGESIDVALDGIENVPDKLFPEPRALVRARLENLGVIGSRAQTIRNVARAVVNGDLCFDAAQSTEDFCRTLTSIKGIGDWTAAYVAMRVLKDPDALPASDLGLLRAFDGPWTRRLTMYYCYLDTPIGELLLAGEDRALAMIGFPKGSMRREPEPDWIFNEKPLANARKQLREYFAGERREFDLPLKLSGTEFQVSVLEALLGIPYGETTSYGEIARRIGRPKAVRAVGAANGRNPIPIVVPCHRVIGSTGDLTGFGGGLDTKEALLRLEAEHTHDLL